MIEEKSQNSLEIGLDESFLKIEKQTKASDLFILDEQILHFCVFLLNFLLKTF
jgi:hypothetical protein